MLDASENLHFGPNLSEDLQQCVSQDVRLKCQLCGEKLVWRIFFLHFISHILYHQSFAPIGLQKNPDSGWLVKKISVSAIVIF
jgi:hypothetical protein